MKKGYKTYLKIKKVKLWYEHALIGIGKKHKSIGFRNKILALKYNFSNYFFDLYKLNKDNIKDYISEYSRYVSREIDGEYKFLLDNKIAFTNFFKQYVNVPKILCYINKKIESLDGQEMSKEAFLKLIENKKVILKPIEEGGGSGIFTIENKKDKYYFDYKLIEIEELYDKIKNLNDYIVNEYIKQHEYSANIYPNSANTIRIVTIKDPKTNKFIIPIAVHRFGSLETGSVDNASRGGYVSMIDIKNGILGETKKFCDTTSITNHPDTKAKIKGVKIPNWNKITKELIDVASNFPYMPFIAWDVVVTKDGFIVLEANASSGLAIFQIFGSLKNNKLWDFYKYYGIIK